MVRSSCIALVTILKAGVLGIIEFSTTEPINCSGIKLLLTGESSCQWRDYTCMPRYAHNPNNKEYRKETFKGCEIFLIYDEYVLGNETGNAVLLKPGLNAFRFSCGLPSDLPSSYKSDYGSIHFWIETVVFLGFPINSKYSEKISFHVVDSDDIDSNPFARDPISSEMSKSFFGILGKSEPMTTSVTLPRSCFASGEVVPLNISIKNKSGVGIKFITVEVIQLTTYSSQTPKSIQKVDETVLAKNAVNEIPNPDGEIMQLFMTLPELRPVKHCKIISTAFEFYVTLQMKGLHSYPTLKIPFEAVGRFQGQ